MERGWRGRPGTQTLRPPAARRCRPPARGPRARRRPGRAATEDAAAVAGEVGGVRVVQEREAGGEGGGGRVNAAAVGGGGRGGVAGGAVGGDGGVGDRRAGGPGAGGLDLDAAASQDRG